jgi:hypothetical protein
MKMKEEIETGVGIGYGMRKAFKDNFIVQASHMK